MRDVIPDIDEWLARGEKIALATVIQTWGSAPRGVGAKMAMTAKGQISGSVSGGCVEGAVIEAGVEVLRHFSPRLLHFGVADETAWEVGLACGGTIEIFVEPLDPRIYRPLRAAVDANQGLATVTFIQGPQALLGRTYGLMEDGSTIGHLGDDLNDLAGRLARRGLEEGTSTRVVIDSPEREKALEDHAVDSIQNLEVFINVVPPPPTLIMIGGVHIAIALSALAKTMGYRTIVIDPRRSFGSQERFPQIDRLIQAWPEEALAEVGLSSATAIAMLTHDPKIDDPALKIALDSPVFYVGALGSRKTQSRRRARLRASGIADNQLARIHGPIGLEIGAQTPEEIALSVMAQVVAARNNHLSR